MRIEQTTYTVEKYIADDGKTFMSREDCERYEDSAYIIAMTDYIEGKAVFRDGGDDRFGIAGYLGCDGFLNALVKVDEKIVEFAEYVNTPYFNGERGRKFLGQYTFLSYNQDFYDTESWDIEGTVDDVIKMMMDSIGELRELTGTDVSVEAGA